MFPIVSLFCLCFSLSLCVSSNSQSLPMPLTSYRSTHHAHTHTHTHTRDLRWYSERQHDTAALSWRGKSPWFKLDCIVSVHSIRSPFLFRRRTLLHHSELFSFSMCICEPRPRVFFSVCIPPAQLWLPTPIFISSFRMGGFYKMEKPVVVSCCSNPGHTASLPTYGAPILPAVYCVHECQTIASSCGSLVIWFYLDLFQHGRHLCQCTRTSTIQ